MTPARRTPCPAAAPAVPETARTGRRHVRLHDLCHTWTSLLLAQAVPPRVVMEALGLSTIAVTMNTYSHVLPSLQRDAADRMNDLLA